MLQLGSKLVWPCGIRPSVGAAHWEEEIRCNKLRSASPVNIRKLSQQIHTMSTTGDTGNPSINTVIDKHVDISF